MRYGRLVTVLFSVYRNAAQLGRADDRAQAAWHRR